MRRALLRAGHEEEEVDSAIARLRRERLLDDGRFAERFALSRIAQQGLGQRRVEVALRQRGVSSKAARAGLASALQEVSEAEVLDSLARRRWKTWVRDEPERRMRRLWRFLLGRGFPPALVRDRLRLISARHLDALEPELLESVE